MEGGDGGHGRVAGDVGPRHRKRDRPEVAPAGAQVERHPVAPRPQALDTEGGIGGRPHQVGAVGPAELGGHGVVGPHHHGTGPPRAEAVEGVHQGRETAVVVEVVRLHIGDDGHLGVEAEERPVALVGLDHQPRPRVPHGVGADLVDVPADEEAGAKTRLHQDERQHGRGRRLPVGPRHGHAATTGGHRGRRLGPATGPAHPGAALRPPPGWWRRSPSRW